MSFLYTNGIEKIGTGQIDLDTDTIMAQCVATGSGAYAASQSGDAALSDIPAGARVGSPVQITGASFTGGVFDGADVTAPNSSSTQVGAVVIYKESAGSPTDEAACWLIAYIDSGTGLPYSPAGADIPIFWSNGANKIFKIS